MERRGKMKSDNRSVGSMVASEAIWKAIDRERLPQLFAADTAWGIAAVLWLATGLARVFAGEKAAAFYGRNGLFWTKMGLFVLVCALEVRPMATFIRWRIATKKGAVPDFSRAPALARINHIELAVIVIIPFVAAFMARGGWLF